VLGKVLEPNNETTAVAMQRRDKHASTRIELLLETVFSTRSVQRDSEEDNWGYPVSWKSACEEKTRKLASNGRPTGGYQFSSVREIVNKIYLGQEFYSGVCLDWTWRREAEESPLLEAVARERLVKTQQAGKGFAGAAVICKLWRLAVAL
jgi:hypothetical protein